MTIDDYRDAAIAIGTVAAARDMIEKAKNDVEYNFDNRFANDFKQVWTILNQIVCELVCELNDKVGQDQESVKKESAHEEA